MARAWLSSSSKRAFLYMARFGPFGVHWLECSSGYITMSGSSLPAIHESANRSCSFVRSLARYAPHSIVCSATLTPTALRLDWITVDIATGDCIPDPDSGTHSGGENPLG